MFVIQLLQGNRDFVNCIYSLWATGRPRLSRIAPPSEDIF